jgi:hypothetical protein
VIFEREEKKMERKKKSGLFVPERRLFETFSSFFMPKFFEPRVVAHRFN